MNIYTIGVDMIAFDVGVMSANTEAMTVRRLLLLPVIIGVMAMILVQEGVIQMAQMPREVERTIDKFPFLATPEYAPYAFLTALVILLMLGVNTYQRTMYRINYTRLDQ